VGSFWSRWLAQEQERAPVKDMLKQIEPAAPKAELPVYFLSGFAVMETPDQPLPAVGEATNAMIKVLYYRVIVVRLAVPADTLVLV